MRLKRDIELRELSVIEKADLERRRNLTEAERYEEDKLLGKFDKVEKPKWKFLQVRLFIFYSSCPYNS
jgi:hypothetical protein